MARLAEVAILRRMEEDDVPFVKDGWLNDWRKSKYAGVIPNHLYYDTTRTLIEDLIARGAQVIVAQHPNGSLLGFACGEVKEDKTVLHYIFVKDAFRGHGLEDKLLNALPGSKPGFFCFATERLMKDRKWQWTPEIARRLNL